MSANLIAVAAATAGLGAVLAAVYAHFERIPKHWATGRRRRLSWIVPAFIVALSLLVTAAPLPAVASALVIVTLIGTASRLKHAEAGLNLIGTDIRLLLDGGARFLAQRRPVQVAACVAITLAAILALAALRRIAPEPHAPLLARLAVAIMSAIALHRETRRQVAANNLGVATFCGTSWLVSGFVASLVVGFGPTHALAMQQVGETASQTRPEAAGHGTRPHMIAILHESTFDPGIYGLAVPPDIEAFLRPPGALSGRLHVDVVGGHTWQSEFSFIAGLPSLLFGREAPFIFYSAAGRLRRTLASVLAARGYGATVMHAIKRGFGNYEAFYASIGMTMIAGEDTSAALVATNDDGLLYAAAIDRLAATIADGPQMLLLLTMFNHDPYTTRPLAAQMRERVRYGALADFPSPIYAEYLTRMDYCARTYASFRAALAERFPGQPFVIARFGDHQPYFVKKQLAHRVADAPGVQHQTFYAIEAVNHALDGSARAPCDPLDLAFLGTLAMKAAGLRLDPLMQVHDNLMAECGSAYFDTPSEAKRRYHRLLLDSGAIDAKAAEQ